MLKSMLCPDCRKRPRLPKGSYCRACNARRVRMVLTRKRIETRGVDYERQAIARAERVLRERKALLKEYGG